MNLGLIVLAGQNSRPFVFAQGQSPPSIAKNIPALSQRTRLGQGTRSEIYDR